MSNFETHLPGVSPLLVVTAFMVLPGAFLGAQLEAQDAPPPLAGVQSTARCPAPVPFGVGERMDFEVRLGRLRVGEAQVQVLRVESVRGHRAYLLDWTLEGGIPLARVNDHYQSWMDVETLASRRFVQDIHQIRRERLRHFELYPEEGWYERVDAQVEYDLVSDRPLDDVSFVFYARTLDLEVGDTITLNRYFREHGNPVTLEVLRREEIEVPAGTFQAMVIRPVIQSRGLWDEDSEAEVYISDDPDRLILRVTTRVPIIGSLSLHLRDARAGLRLVGNC